MPEEIEKILELARPSAPQATGKPTVAKSARVSRICGLLALGSVVFFWLMIGLFYLAEKSGGNTEKLFEFLLVSECCLLPCLSITAVITAIIGLVGAKRHPGNRKAAVWAIVLTLVAVTGFLAPIIIYFSRHPLQIG
jgi:hypothetical protein